MPTNAMTLEAIMTIIARLAGHGLAGCCPEKTSLRTHLSPSTFRSGLLRDSPDGRGTKH
jgi:hypothetical protein